jgi:poly [ADP-ribose] polymerase
MLNVISDVGAAVSSQKKVKNKKKGALEQAPIDAAYESVGALLQPISEGSDELKMIRTFTENTAGYRKMKVESAFKVERHTELKDNFEQHKDLKERKLLWHGTNLAVVAAILKSGLRIMPHSGGRVGAGLDLLCLKHAGFCGP